MIMAEWGPSRPERQWWSRRPIVMTRYLGLLIGFVVLLASAGCAGSGPPQLTTPCQIRRLAVTFDGDAVRVTNRGPACQFAGVYPVLLTAWRIEGEVPPARGTLPMQATYVQPYRAVGSNGCPGGVFATNRGIRVVVENTVVIVVTSGRTAYEVTVCEEFAPGTATIES